MWFALTMLLAAVPGLPQASPEVSSAKTGTPKAGYSLTIVPPTDQIQLGAPINITIIVKNTSSNDIYWRAELDNTAYHAFHFLLQEGGKEVETTRFHRVLRNELRPDDKPESAEGSASSVVSALESGKSFTLTIDLTKLYEITQPGQYMLKISRTEEDNKTVVNSNTVPLNIIP
jgi:hypothetical protein